MFRFLFALILCTILSLPFSNAQEFSSEKAEKINRYLNKNTTDIKPGIAAGIIKDGKIIYEHYNGYANLEHQVKLDEDSRINIASVAKQFTALCVLKLADEGKLSIEVISENYLPDYYPNITSTIAIKHLLNHSSGIRDYCMLMSIQQRPWWKQVGFSNKKALQLIKAQQTLNFEPGSDHIYSNSNYTLLTKIVETVSGIPFPKYVKQLFLELDMPSSEFSTNYMIPAPHLARPYTDWGNGQWKEYPMLTNLYGDGFLYTNLQDQLTYEQLLQNPEAPQWLKDSQAPIPNTNIQHYGYGLEFDTFRDFPVVKHAGATGSYHAQVLRFPKQQLSIMVMSNNGNVWSGYIAEKIADIMLETQPPSTDKAEEASAPETPKFKASNSLSKSFGRQLLQ